MFRSARSPLPRIALVALAMAIFFIDAFTPLDIAIAVLYVVVVLLSAHAWPRQGVLATTVVCMGLTVTAYLASHSMIFSGPASGRCLVSLAAIGITGFLALAGQAATAGLLEREESLRRSRVQLAHVTRVTTLGELAASIAHEVNQPLAAISTNGDACLRWIDRAEPDMEEARAAITRMLSDTRRASDVIRRIRALARRSDPQQLPLDLNEVAGEAAALVQRELASHNVALTLDLGAGLPSVLGDRVQLQQVIINLLINGMQAMSARGMGQLRLETVASGDGGVLLSVSDTGPGIAPEDAGRLFEAFYTTKADGMGMGLPICRSIIEAHGGRIAAVARPAPGATLQFTLPALGQET